MRDAKLIEKIEAINFAAIRNYLKREKGWNADLIDLIENQYRRFLYLLGMYPDEELVPWSELLSEFWQAHVLHTTQYNQNCLDLFGRIINYRPYIGDDLARKEQQLARMRELHLREFGPQRPSETKPDDSEARSGVVQNAVMAPMSSLPLWMLVGAELDWHHLDHSDSEDRGHDHGLHHDGGSDSDFDDGSDYDVDDDIEDADADDFEADFDDFGDDFGDGGGDG